MAATFLVVAVVGATPAHAATGASERRVALIIGNDTYTHLPALNNARKDAEDMAVKLRELGFETILKVNAGRRDMHRSIRQFEAKLSDGATGLAFFAGHGIQSDGKNFLIPTDANIEVEDDLEAEALTAQHVLAAMERAGNPLNIVILDACRDNPLPKRTRSARRGLTVVGIPAGAKGTAILYAAGEGQTAEDGPRGGNGVFTGELLRVLDEPGLSLEQVFKRVNRRVQLRTNNRQRPWSLVSLQGDFVFRGGENELATPRPSGGTTAEVAFWQTIKDSRDKTDFEAYLKAFRNGVFVPLAETRLASLGEPNAPIVEIEEIDATYVALKTANLRSGPSTTTHKVGLVAKDSELAVTGRVANGKWLRVAYAGGSAFVFAPLVKEVDLAELASWRELGNTPSRERLQAHLTRFGDGHFEARGRAMLAALPPPTSKIEVTRLSSVMWVGDGGAVIRTSPDGTAGEIDRLSAGAHVDISGKVNGLPWYRIALADGRSGFAFGGALMKIAPTSIAPSVAVIPKPVTTPPKPEVHVTVQSKTMKTGYSSTPIWSEPSKSSSHLSQLEMGSEAEITGHVMLGGEKWYRVAALGGSVGYVLGKHLREKSDFSRKYTPRGMGLLPTALAEAKTASVHAKLANKRGASLEAMKRHITSVLHAIDPDVVVQGPGLGYGVKRALAGIEQFAIFLIKKMDAPKAHKQQAAYVASAAENTLVRANKIVFYGMRVLSSRTASQAKPWVANTYNLAKQLTRGVDANGDRRISWTKGEGGINVVRNHLERIKRDWESRKTNRVKDGGSDSFFSPPVDQ
jgi:hypothetical protein